MLRAIQLAKSGMGVTFPNPMVGSVIVYDGKIIGEGSTSTYGGPHAEVNAINSVRDKSLLSKATLYVTLEPCSHHGKTPPCADLIVKYSIPEVVIGIEDPHTKVAGKGIKKLEEAGCHITLGVLENECREHHKRFLTFHERKRPYIILKWAETSDGFIAPIPSKRKTQPEPYWITNHSSRQLVHKWRAEEEAILVGTNTILEDNPRLDTRKWKGKSPVRVIIDKTLRINGQYHVLDGNRPTIIATAVNDVSRYKKNMEYRTIDLSKSLAWEICKMLHAENILSVIVEGGAQTLKTFIDKDLWDEARVFTGKVVFGTGLRAPKISGQLLKSRLIDGDSLKIIRND